MKQVSYSSLRTGILIALACGCATEPPEAPVATTSGALSAGGTSILDEPIEIGYFTRWCGKVNMFWSWNLSSWQSDPDCTTGCNVDPVAYCQKFFPSTNYAAQIFSSMKTGWMNQGCVSANAAATGEEWVCLM